MLTCFLKCLKSCKNRGISVVFESLVYTKLIRAVATWGGGGQGGQMPPNNSDNALSDFYKLGKMLKSINSIVIWTSYKLELILLEN